MQREELLEYTDDKRKTKTISVLKKKSKSIEFNYHLMLLPGMILVFIFSIIPMFGVVMAFQNYKPALGILGSEWVGLEHFKYMFQLPDSRRIFLNTIIIAIGKIIVGMIVPIFFALILNEARVKWFKKSVQTIVYLPNFLSWVVLGTVISMIFSTTYSNCVIPKLSFLFFALSTSLCFVES